MKRKQFIYSTISVVLLCALICFVAKKFLIKTEDSTSESVAATTSKPPETTMAETTDNTFTIKLSFVGDCLCATDEYTNYENCFNDVADAKEPSYFLEKVSDIFLNDDFTMADCENVFSDNSDLSVSDKGQYADPNMEAYWFKSAAKNASILSSGGIDGVSISNNHINDYGTTGHDDTRKALDAANVKWGEEGTNIYFEKNGYSISIICVSMYSSYAVDSIKTAIEASAKSDYQIVYFHGGEEAVHTPEDWKIQACHDLVDAGADLIMGDHPHVLQPVETYNGVTIIYSLGNFIFGGNRHPENRTIIYQHELTITDSVLSGQSGTITPCYVYTGDTNNWQPDIITNKSQKKKVLRFMNGKTDLPY